MGQAGMKNNWKRNTRYMGVFAVLAAFFCMIVVLNINTGNVQISGKSEFLFPDNNLRFQD